MEPELAVNVPAFDQSSDTLRLVEAANVSVPAWMSISPTVELLPDKINAEVLLFCVIPVTLLPITAEMVVVPLPAPELVIVPVLLTPVTPFERVIVCVLAPLKIKLPVPEIAPLTILLAPFVAIVKLLLSVIAPLKVLADDV